MKVAVTGASGYLGRNFINLYDNEYDIIALGRGYSSPPLPSGVKYFQSDYSCESLKSILEGCDAVVHLAYAMATKENEQHGMDAYRSSMDATESILRSAAELGIKNIVFASSRLVYPSSSDEPFKEDSLTNPGTSYGMSKVMMEKVCDDYNRSGLFIKVLRFGQIIGADMKVRGMFQIFMESAQNNKPLMLIGSDIRDYICVKDACRAIAFALNNPDSFGIYNISMGLGTNNRMMAESIIREKSSKSEIIVDKGNEKEEGNKLVLDCTKAREVLGFECRYDTIEKIVADVCKYENIR